MTAWGVRRLDGYHTNVGSPRNTARLGDKLSEGGPSKLLIFNVRYIFCYHFEPGGRRFDNPALRRVGRRRFSGGGPERSGGRGRSPSNPSGRTLMQRSTDSIGFRTWRGPWSRGQRCILPATGFYEWQVRAASRKPSSGGALAQRALRAAAQAYLVKSLVRTEILNTVREAEVLRLVASGHANKESGAITRLKSEPPACTLSLWGTSSRDRL